MLVMDSNNNTSNSHNTNNQNVHQPTQPRKQSLTIDPRFIPKSLFKFHKSAGTDDERMAMLERFRLEGVDPRKLNDSKKLPHVWRWLVDAEINCQSLRHQLEKMCLQHEQEIQEVEAYVGHVWKLSMQRLSSLQEENRLLHSKLMLTNKQLSPCHDLNNNGNNDIYEHQDEEEEDDDDDENEDSHDIGKFLRHNHLPASGHRHQFSSSKHLKLVNKKNNNTNSHIQLPHSMSTSSLFPPTRTAKSSILRRSTSCLDLTIDEKGFFGNNRDVSVKFQCRNCRKFNSDLIRYEKQLSAMHQQLRSAEEQNSVMKKLNRCIEIENENFAYKLSESESQNNQLEKRIVLLEQELRSRRNHCSISSSQLESQALVINEQRSLINELNDKVKHLEEQLDAKQILLEDLQMKFKTNPINNKREQHYSTSNNHHSSWFRKNTSSLMTNSNKSQRLQLQQPTSDYGSTSSDGFEEIKL